MLDKRDLTPKDRDLLNKTLAKGIDEMNEEDKAIIRARREYLSPVEKINAKEVLNEKKEEDKTPAGKTGSGKLATPIKKK